jgi:putative phosphoribosyl transferase
MTRSSRSGIRDVAKPREEQQQVPPLFRNRVDAGEQLAIALLTFRRASPLVLGLLSGGVPVAYAVADRLRADLDVVAVHAGAHTLELRGRAGAPAPEVAGRLVIVVADGLATAAKMRAAVASLRTLGARYVVAGAPVGACDACRAIRREADELVCPYRPDPFGHLADHYASPEAPSDVDVERWLQVRCTRRAALR